MGFNTIAKAGSKFLFNNLDAVAKKAPTIYKSLGNPNQASIKSINSFLGQKGNEAVGEELITAAANKDFGYINTFKASADESWVKNHKGNKTSKLANPTDAEQLYAFKRQEFERTHANRLKPEDLDYTDRGYKPIDLQKLEEYKQSELDHWIRHDRGSGNYFIIEHATDPTKRQRIKFNSQEKYNVEGYEGKLRRFSWQNVEVKNRNNSKVSKIRGPIARATTTNKKNIGLPQVLKPAGTKWHHSIPSQSTGKIYEAYMRYLNPKFKLTKNAPRNREFLRMLREVEEEFGVKFGDDPLNARYLKDDPEHGLWHETLKEFGIDPKDITRALKDETEMNAFKAREWLEKLAQASIEVDNKMGFDRTVLGI